MGPLVEIFEVSWFDQDQQALVGCNLDAPQIGAVTSTYSFPLGGWILGKRAQVSRVEIVCENRALRSVPITETRRDVGERYPANQAALKSGFWTEVGVAGLPPQFEILVQAVLTDETRVPLAVIRGRHEPIRTSYNPKFQPLMITTWGRSGSTFLMKLLLSHQQFVGFGLYPYEVRAAAYWMHLVKVLAEPCDHFNSTHPDNFTEDLQWVGHMPFHSETLTLDPRLKAWFGREYVERLAEFGQNSVQSFYSELAANQDRNAVKYFVEKHHPNHTSWLMWELYPQAREIFLVRDFRDVICSILAFNHKRGFASFGTDRAKTNEEFVELQRVGAECLLRSWQARARSACLVRYEDLVLQPVDSLNRIFNYLGLECSAPDLNRLIEACEVQTTELQQHRTTSDTQASIGRWRTELEPELRSQCQNALAPFLAEFGYAV